MTDDDAGRRGVKNCDFWMTSFVNDPLQAITQLKYLVFKKSKVNINVKF